MPYDIVVDGSTYIVRKRGTTKVLGTHRSRKDAQAQQAALYAAEGPQGTNAKAWTEPMKAEPMEGARLDRWLAGKLPRRLLVVPYTGPLPGGKAGLDIDGEYFDRDTDLYGPFLQLRNSRERLVDWHHDMDPTGTMKGAILGRIVLDDDPEDDGHWADFWANAGEQRRHLVAHLERAGVQLYGSSLAVPGAVRKASDGHIEVWPLIRHTITTSPQNTHAVVPPLVDLMTADYPSEAVGKASLVAALLGLGDTSEDLPVTWRHDGADGDLGATVGRLAKAPDILAEADRLLARLRARTTH